MPNSRLCRVEGGGFGGLIQSFLGKINRDLGSRYFANWTLNWRTGASETRINHNLRRGHIRNERRLLAEKIVNENSSSKKLENLPLNFVYEYLDRGIRI